MEAAGVGGTERPAAPAGRLVADLLQARALRRTRVRAPVELGRQVHLREAEESCSLRSPRNPSV